MARLIRTTFSRTTPESVEQGDFSETGWIDEEGEEIELDKYDDEEETLITKTVNWLQDHYACHASSYPFSLGCWYHTQFEVLDYSTGEEEERSFHLTGFSPEEEEAIYSLLKTN